MAYVCTNFHCFIAEDEAEAEAMPAGSGYGCRSIVERLSKKKLFTKLCHTSLWMYYIRATYTHTYVHSLYLCRAIGVSRCDADAAWNKGRSVEWIGPLSCMAYIHT